MHVDNEIVRAVKIIVPIREPLNLSQRWAPFQMRRDARLQLPASGETYRAIRELFPREDSPWAS